MIGRFVAPAGAPIRPGDLGRWLGSAARWSEAESQLAVALRTRTGRAHCAVTCTGRAGLSVLLSAMAGLGGRDRDEVIIPSYTCYSVAASVVRAGLRPRIVDVDPRFLDFDLDALAAADSRRVLAVVATSLYGYPGRMAAIAQIARDRGAFLVDDAAQSFGARVDGRPAGAWGDAGLLSFDKGKNVSAIDGGALLVDRDDLADEVARRVAALPRPSSATSLGHMVKLGAYAALLRPELYWIPNAIPGLGLGLTMYQPDFAIERQAPSLAALALTMVGRLDEFQRARTENARRLLEAVRAVPGITPIQAVEGADPAFLRLPLLAPDTATRDRIVAACREAGIGATASYPKALADVPELAGVLAGTPDAPVGRDVAARVFTLPTHPYVTARDCHRAADAIAAVCGGARTSGAPVLPPRPAAGVPLPVRVKRMVRGASAELLFASGVLRLWTAAVLSRKAVVLMYHRVLSERDLASSWSHPGIVVRRETFERHLRVITRYLRPLSLETFEAHLRTRSPFPARSCLVTFDDGWRDTYTEAWPLLRRYGVPAVVFMPVAYIGGDRMFWQEQLNHLIATVCTRAAADPQLSTRARDLLQPFGLSRVLDLPVQDLGRRLPGATQALKDVDVARVRRLIDDLLGLAGPGVPPWAPSDAFMSWDMAREMSGGGIHFGAHSVTHRLMTTLTPAELVDEVAQSRARVRKEVGPGVESFSYPNGSWNPEVAAEVGRNGFAVSFTTEPGTVSAADDRLALRRVNVHEHVTSTEAMFLAHVTGVL